MLNGSETADHETAEPWGPERPDGKSTQVPLRKGRSRVSRCGRPSYRGEKSSARRELGTAERTPQPGAVTTSSSGRRVRQEFPGRLPTRTFEHCAAHGLRHGNLRTLPVRRKNPPCRFDHALDLAGRILPHRTLVTCSAHQARRRKSSEGRSKTRPARLTMRRESAVRARSVPRRDPIAARAWSSGGLRHPSRSSASPSQNRLGVVIASCDLATEPVLVLYCCRR